MEMGEETFLSMRESEGIIESTDEEAGKKNRKFCAGRFGNLTF